MKTICLAIIALAFGVLLAAPAQAHGVSFATQVLFTSADGQTVVSADQTEKITMQDCDQKQNSTPHGSCCNDMTTCCVASTVVPTVVGVTVHLSYGQQSPAAMADQIGPSAIPDPQFKPPRSIA